MGLSPTPATGTGAVIAPAATGILDPATGKPIGAADPYFLEVKHELSDKGFFVAAADDLIIWARTGSLMWMTFGLACCAVATSLKNSTPVSTAHPNQFILITITLLLAQMHKRPGASAVLARGAG